MATHVLKTLQPFFDDVVLRDKRFEVRFNDRNYQLNDYVYLCEFDIINDCYTGNVILVKINYVLKDERYLKDNFCCFSFKILRHLSGVLDITKLQIY